MRRCQRCHCPFDESPYLEYCASCGDWLEEHVRVTETHLLDFAALCGWALTGSKPEAAGRVWWTW